MLLVFGVVVAGLTALSFRPPLRPGTFSFLVWFPCWLICELPWHAAATAITWSAVLVYLDGPNVVGLALVAAALVGLARHARMAARAEEAIDAVVGGARASRAASLGRLAMVLPFTPPGIERIRNLPYGLAGRRNWLDVWRPAGVAAGERRPSLLFVHGGGWVIGDKELQGFCTLQELVAAGWVCFTMNYRLSPRAVFPDHLEDVKRAIAWIRRHGADHGADPELLIICGASAGGHLASLAALDPALRLQGCVSYYGLYDLTGTVVPYPNRAFQTLLLERMIFQRRRDDDPQAFADASPILRVTPEAPPFFVLHGDRDSLAPVGGARLFVDKLRETSRAPVVYAELPGGQHAFELFSSIRGAAAVDGVRRFCERLAATAAAREGTLAPTPAPRP